MSDRNVSGIEPARPFWIKACSTDLQLNRLVCISIPSGLNNFSQLMNERLAAQVLSQVSRLSGADRDIKETFHQHASLRYSWLVPFTQSTSMNGVM